MVGGSNTAIGCNYSFHHWHESVDHIIGQLKNMVAALEDFQAHTNKK